MSQWVCLIDFDVDGITISLCGLTELKMEKPVVRHAIVGDRERVQKIATDIMLSFGLEPDFAGLDYELGRFGDAAFDQNVYLVAQIASIVVGSLILSPLDADTLKLSAFYVDAAARGHGAGRQLLRNAVSIGLAKGYRRIYLETWEAMTAAVHLYTELGWRRGERLAPSSGAQWSYVLDLASTASPAESSCSS